MDDDRRIEVFEAAWRGIPLQIKFERDWLNASRSKGYVNSHLWIESASGEPLPIAATGWRSRFLFPDEIDRAGGPVAYALDWLDRAALDKSWVKRHVNRQPKLL